MYQNLAHVHYIDTRVCVRERAARAWLLASVFVTEEVYGMCNLSQTSPIVSPPLKP